MDKRLKNKPLISVIIPCFNQGEFVNEAIDSVLNQTYKNVEIIIINDGSTDPKTIEIFKNLKRPKTILIKTRNQGLAATRNLGFKKAKGDFIQFLDADDLLEPTKFEEQLKIFSENDDIDICISSYVIYKESEKTILKKHLDINIDVHPLRDFLYRWQREISFPPHCALFKKNVWLDSEPFVSSFKAIEDWIMWVDCAYRDKKFIVLDKELVLYRIHDNNMSSKRDYMLYWVSLAIAYISEHYLDSEEIVEFENETQKYIKHLIEIYYLNEIIECKEMLKNQNISLTNRLSDLIKENNNLSERYTRTYNKYLNLLNSRDYNFGKILLYFPRKLKNLINKISK